MRWSMVALLSASALSGLVVTGIYAKNEYERWLKKRIKLAKQRKEIKAEIKKLAYYYLKVGGITIAVLISIPISYKLCKTSTRLIQNMRQSTAF